MLQANQNDIVNCFLGTVMCYFLRNSTLWQKVCE